jgi:spermidine/putrescine-binding protein
VVFYNGQTGWPEPIAAAKSFEAKYGIKVEMLEVRSVELMERIRTEVTNNKVGGDITLMGSTGTAPLAQAGLLQPHGAIPNQAKAVLKPWVPEEIPVFVINYGVAINTRLVPPGQEPKSWKDLADPKWKGKILSDEMIFPGRRTKLVRGDAQDVRPRIPRDAGQERSSVRPQHSGQGATCRARRVRHQHFPSTCRNWRA